MHLCIFQNVFLFFIRVNNIFTNNSIREAQTALTHLFGRCSVIFQCSALQEILRLTLLEPTETQHFFSCLETCKRFSYITRIQNFAIINLDVLLLSFHLVKSTVSIFNLKFFQAYEKKFFFIPDEAMCPIFFIFINLSIIFLKLDHLLYSSSLLISSIVVGDFNTLLFTN